MKRILVTTSTLPLTAGDAEPRFVLDLAAALGAFYRVTVLAPASPGAALRETLNGVDIIRYRYAPLRRWEKLAYPGAIRARLAREPLYWALVPMLLAGLYLAERRLLARRPFDLVHCHWFAPQGLVQACGLSGSGRPPFVVTAHGGDLSSLRGPVIDALYRRVFERAAAVTVVSSSLYRFLPAPPDKVWLTPMGADTSRFAAARAQPVNVERTRPDDPVVLFVGRLVEKKGVHVLLEAMATDRIRHLGPRLLVVGDGPERPALERRCRQLEFGDRVSFLGPLGHDALAPLYAGADLLCAPSVIAANGDIDGLPTVLIESGAAGLPAVGTAVGGLGDFIEDGVTGRLVPANDPDALGATIVSVLTDPGLRRRLARGAAEKARSYDWRIVARRFADVFEQAMARSA